MKTTLTLIVTFLCAAAAADVSATSGAADFYQSGTAAEQSILTAQAEKERALQQNASLLAQAKDLAQQQGRLQTATTTWQTENTALQQRVSKYNGKCLGQPASDAAAADCSTEHDAINSLVAKVNTDRDLLNKQISDVNGLGAKYNLAVQQMTASVTHANDDYITAINNEADWLVATVNQLNSPSLEPLASKAGCPAVRKQPTTDDALRQTAQGLLGCLKKFPSKV